MTNPDREELVKLADRLAALPTFKLEIVTTVPGVALNAAERDLIVTALRRLASSDGGVKVRELEWEKSEGNLSGQIVWSSGDPWVFWIVKDADKPSYVWCENFNIEGWCPASPVRGVFDTLDAAKAAAQADYASRIRSALVEMPAVKGEPEPVAWIDFADNCSVRLWTSEKHRADAEMALGRKMTPVYTAPPADAGMREALEVLVLFRAFVQRNVTRWELGAGDHHHPMWGLVAETLGDLNRDEINCGDRWRFIQPNNRKALTAPGATTKSDGGARSLTADETRLVEQALRDSGELVETLSSPSDPSSDDTDTCIACAVPLVDGDMVYSDAGGGCIHAACCGPERESYVGNDGKPLKDGEPIPAPWPWTADPSSTRSDVTVDDLVDVMIDAGLLFDDEHEAARALLDQFEIRRKK